MNIKQSLDANSPAILTGLGIGGFLATMVLVAKVAGPAENILHEMEEDESSRLEKIKAVAPIYAPAVGLALLSTGALIASHQILNRRYASIFALYSVTEAMLGRWQDSALKELGPKKFTQVKRNTMEPRKDIPETPPEKEGWVLFWDDWTSKYFWAPSVEMINKAVNEVNEIAIKDDFATLNDYYYKLGLPPVPYGHDVGWGVGGHLLEIDKEAFLTDSNATPISITFKVWPKGYSEVVY